MRPLLLAVVLSSSWLSVGVAPAQAEPAPFAYEPRFVQNQGQWSTPELFRGRCGPFTVFVESDGWRLVAERATSDERLPIEGIALRMRFVGSQTAAVRIEEPLKSVSNYMIGKDRSQWRTRVPHARSLLFENVKPGIDVRLTAGAHPKYDVILAPGARLDDLVVEVEGAESLHLASNGDLDAKTTFGPMTQPVPVSWQTVGGDQELVDVRYCVLEENRFGFAADERDPDAALIVDPQLLWGTLWGGLDFDFFYDLDGDDRGHATVVGNTHSPNFPTTFGAYQRQQVFESGFASQFDADGALIFSTLFGGDREDSISKVCLTADYGVVVAGISREYVPGALPVTPGALQPTPPSGAGSQSYQNFLAQFSADGTALDWCTYFGGNDWEYWADIEMTPAGQLVVAGMTDSTDFPTTVGPPHNGNDERDAYVCLIDPVGAQALIWSRFHGGIDDDWFVDMALSSSGDVVVAGQSWSADFPVTPGALDSTLDGTVQPIAARFSLLDGSVTWSTFVGDTARVEAMALDEFDRPVIIGNDVIPATADAWSSPLTAFQQAYIARISADGTQLDWSLGSPASFDDVLIDEFGINLVSHDAGPLLPTTPNGNDISAGDARIVRFSHDGKALTYSARILDGFSTFSGLLLTRTGEGRYAVSGEGVSPITPGAPISTTTGLGARSGFVLGVQVGIPGVTRHGDVSTTCLLRPTAFVTAEPNPAVGPLSLACDGLVATISGGLLVGTASSPGYPLPIGGTLWIDSILASVPVSTDVQGDHSIQLPISAALSGATFHFQYFWNDLGCFTQPMGLSDALEVTIQ